MSPDDRLEIDADPALLAPRRRIPVRIMRRGEVLAAFDTVAAVETALEVEQLRAGGVIPLILAGLKRQAGATG